MEISRESKQYRSQDLGKRIVPLGIDALRELLTINTYLESYKMTGNINYAETAMEILTNHVRERTS